MAVYKSFGTNTDIYSNTTDVSSFTIPVDPNAFCTEIWGNFHPVTDAVLPRIAFVDTNGTQLSCDNRMTTSHTFSNVGFTTTFFNGAYYYAGSAGGEEYNFKLKYFSDNSSSSPYTNPWIQYEALYDDSGGTSRNVQAGVLLRTSTTPTGIKFFIYAPSGSANIDRYYAHRTSLLDY